MSLQRTAFSLLQSTFQSQVQNLTYNLNFKDIIYNYIYITFSHLADAFIQSDLQMRTIEEIKTNKRATTCKCYNKSWLAQCSTRSNVFFFFKENK